MFGVNTFEAYLFNIFICGEIACKRPCSGTGFHVTALPLLFVVERERGPVSDPVPSDIFPLGKSQPISGRGE